VSPPSSSGEPPPSFALPTIVLFFAFPLFLLLWFFDGLFFPIPSRVGRFPLMSLCTFFQGVTPNFSFLFPGVKFSFGNDRSETFFVRSFSFCSPFWRFRSFCPSRLRLRCVMNPPVLRQPRDSSDRNPHFGSPHEPSFFHATLVFYLPDDAVLLWGKLRSLQEILSIVFFSDPLTRYPLQYNLLSAFPLHSPVFRRNPLPHLI